MKAGDIVALVDALGSVKDKKLPIRVELILARNAKKLADIADDIEDKRQTLVEKYGERDEDGELVIEDGRVPMIDGAAFRREYDELIETDIEVTLDRLSMEDLEKCDSDKFDSLTVEEVASLHCIIDEP